MIDMTRKGRERARRANLRKRLILILVTRNPGIHLRELERESGIALGALRNILDSLLNSELIIEKKIPGFRTFFSSRGIERGDREWVTLFRREHLRLIVEKLILTPSISRKDLKNHLNIPRTTLRGHLDHLGSAGIITLDKDIELTEPARAERILLLTKPHIIERMVSAVIEIFDETNFS